jgi:transcriptional regulator with XRE-family HTH domain
MPKKVENGWDRLIELRKNKGLSQEEMAKEFKVTSMTYSRWETRKNVPDLNTVIAMANYFGVSVDYLLDRESNDLTPEESENLKAAADTINEIISHHQKVYTTDVKTAETNDPKKGQN